ncbi:MAG: DUF1559 domain-containing protein [Planctomycetaceae bacterium]|jgi:hypothetical protein|nr:DUF1559 domain-containing protein [Planctomycetaceae bacterium]
MRTFFLTLLFVFAVSISGCSDKAADVPAGSDGSPQNSNSTQTDNPLGNQLNAQKSTVSPPSAEMLSAIGEKQNDLDTRWLFSDSYYVLTGQPKKFFETEIGKGTEDVLSNVFNTVFQLQFPIDYSKVERFTLAAAPQEMVTFDEPAADGTKNSRQTLAIRRVTLFNLSEPIAKTMVQTVWKSLSTTPIESVKKRIGKVEYYDLLPSNFPTNQICAGIHLPDERTIIFFIMLTKDANELFAGKPTSASAAVERIKRMDTSSNLLLLSASWEGVVADPMRMAEIPFVGSILNGLGNENALQFLQNFRAINLAIDTSAQVGKPMLTARYDAIDNNGAANLYELFLGLHITAQTAIAAAKDDTTAQLPLPKETTIDLLKSIILEKTNNTGVIMRINKFDGFDAILKSGFAETTSKLRQEKLAIQKFEQLRFLADASMQYDRLNKKFPQPIRDADGKPLLSWRVAILPLIGQQELYNNFNLKEAWDSPANLQLVEKIPKPFAPIDDNIAKGKTQIQRFTSTGTPLADANLTTTTIKQPQNTLLLVQTSAEVAIEWTKPDELIYDENEVDKIFGNSIVGITFAGVPILQNLLPKDNKQSTEQRTQLSAFIKGEELPTNHDHDHDHDHNHPDHNHNHP